jgi:hypothetical protein
VIPDEYVFFTASAAPLLLWLVLFAGLPDERRVMLWSGLVSAPFALAEPLFLPRHWNPLTLGGLGQQTGLSIESVLFCFGRAGVTAALYDLLTMRSAAWMCLPAVRRSLRPGQIAALASPLLLFAPLYFLPWDPVHAAIVALIVGAAVLLRRRPSVGRRAWIGAVLSLLYQSLFFAILQGLSPGYLARALTPAARAGPWFLGMPPADLVFAAGFGLYWFTVYEYYSCFRRFGEAEAAATPNGAP